MLMCPLGVLVLHDPAVPGWNSKCGGHVTLVHQTEGGGVLAPVCVCVCVC